MGTALRHAAFRRFFVATLITQSGNQLQRVALMVMVYQLSGSNATVALVLSAQLVVSAVVAPLLATWAETQERTRLLILAQLVPGVLVLFIPWLGVKHLPLLWLIVFAMHIFQRLEYPVIAAATPELVPEEDLDAANGLVAFANRFAEVAVVGLSGVLVAAVGPAPAFYLDAISYFVAGALLFGLPRIPGTPAEPGKGYWSRVLEGFQHIARTPLLRRSIGALVTAALLGSVEIVLGVALAIGVMQVGSSGYGAMEMSLAAGAVLGAVTIAYWTRRLGRGTVFSLAFIFFGLVLFAVGLYPVFFWVLPAYFLTGYFNQGFLVPLRSLLQTATPKNLLTRVFGAVGAASQTAVLVGVVGGGAVADWIGVPHTYILGGLGVVLVGLYLVVTGGLRVDGDPASRR